MRVIDLETNKRLSCVIETIKKEDWEYLKKESRFLFDWEKCKDTELYKIYVPESSEILGLISLVDFPIELRIEVNLLEVRKDQVGKKKTINGIAGCLLAYICRLAFQRGYDGFVSLYPKTKLINHYIKEYGFSSYWIQLAIDGKPAYDLTMKYLSK